MSTTDHFGFTRIGPGESLAKNGWAALDGDRAVLDAVLHVLAEHTHDGQDGLADPTAAPNVALAASGGSLPADTVLHYSVAWLDANGLETAASAETAVRTLPALPAPGSPTATVATTGGTLRAGSANYLLTHVDAAGGETAPGQPYIVAIPSGGTNSVTLTLPPRPARAVATRVYRAARGASRYGLLATASGATTQITDTGAAADTSRQPQRLNTTGATASAVITPPTLPPAATGWRVYRALVPGDTSTPALLAELAVSQATYTDTGQPVGAGQRRAVSASLASPPRLTYGLIDDTPPPDDGGGGGGGTVTVAAVKGTHRFTADTPGPVTGTRLVVRSPVPYEYHPLPPVPLHLAVYHRMVPAVPLPAVRYELTDASGAVGNQLFLSTDAWWTYGGSAEVAYSAKVLESRTGDRVRASTGVLDGDASLVDAYYEPGNSYVELPTAGSTVTLTIENVSSGITPITVRSLSGTVAVTVVMTDGYESKPPRTTTRVSGTIGPVTIINDFPYPARALVTIAHETQQYDYGYVVSADYIEFTPPIRLFGELLIRTHLDALSAHVRGGAVISGQLGAAAGTAASRLTAEVRAGGRVRDTELPADSGAWGDGLITVLW